MQAIGGFADFWLWGDPEPTKKFKGRDFRPDVMRTQSCPICGAARGQPCTRRTLAGAVPRKLHHVGRNKPRRINYSSYPERDE